jgi:chromate transporter
MSLKNNFECQLVSFHHILQFGLTVFGGLATHMGILHQEVIQRRKWTTEKKFFYLLGATNLIPALNSTEIVIHSSLVLFSI